MKEITVIFLVLIFSICILNPSLASDSVYSIPTYTLSVANIKYTNPNTIEWDVYLLHTNPTVTPFFYAAGQFYFNFNPNIANGGSLTYSSIGAQSELPPIYRPINPSISGNILRLASNNPGSEEDSVLISSVFPGTRILKLRLRTSAPSFNSENLNLEWRSIIPDPITKIAAFTLKNNFILENISTPATHFMPNPFVAQLLYPPTNSLNNSLSINFIWSKSLKAMVYKLQVSSDSLFNSYFINDSLLTDTIRNVTGLSLNTKYFWRVESTDSLGNKYLSMISNFKTIPFEFIKLNLTVLPEGKYNDTLNIISQRDSIKVYLRNISPPFNIIDSAIGVIDSLNFSNQFSFFNSATNYYYIVVKQKQCIETWSKTGGELLLNDQTVNNYDFTISPLQAYGNNLKLKGSKYCIFSGDINQDNNITLFDVIPIHNAALNYVNGYNEITDLNADLIVELKDILIAYNNSINFVRLKRP